MSSLSGIDLFAGAGGLSLGLRQAGIDVRWASDVDHDAVATHRLAHPECRIFEEDVALLYERVLSGGDGLPAPGEVDLVAGGPPCQGFSGYNRHRRPSDPRNSLVEVFLDFVAYLRPRYVLMENVPGMLSLDSGNVAKRLLEVLASMDYTPRLGILQAGHYGLPQNRWRVFIMAAVRGLPVPEFPAPTHQFPRTTIFGAKAFRANVIRAPGADASLYWRPQPMVTVGDAISDLPAIQNGDRVDESTYARPAVSSFQALAREASGVLFDHRCAKLGPIMFERCRAVPHRPGAGWLDLPPDLKPKNLVRHGDNRYENRFGRLHWAGTFNTILTKPEPYWGRVFHPEQDRVISVRESARAQGFPDRVRFIGELSSRYQQVGNAVPPPLARAIGLAIMEAAGCNARGAAV